MNETTNPIGNTARLYAASVSDLVPPVRRKLALFNPSVDYVPQQIEGALRAIIKADRVKGLDLLPDQNTLTRHVEDDVHTLLVLLATKAFVDLVVPPSLRPRIGFLGHQEAFSLDLNNQIDVLENGEGRSSAR